MNATAKLFKHGNSQAVRLPKEFRFAGTEVRITRVGEQVILAPVQPATSGVPWAALDALDDQPFMPGGREQPPAPVDRRVFDT